MSKQKHLSLKDALRVAVVFIKAGIVPFIWGKPGVGKTSGCRQLAARAKITVDGTAHRMQFKSSRLNQMDICDVLGVPFKDEKVSPPVTEWCAPKFIPREGCGLWLFDEFPQAIPAMQNVASEPLLEHTIGGNPLPQGWRLIAAGNNPDDNCATHRMPEHIKSRFGHVFVESNLDSLIEWANGENEEDSVIDLSLVTPAARLHHKVQAFLLYAPQYLNKAPEKGDYTYPCPRTWEGISRAIYVLEDSPEYMDLRVPVFFGVVGIEAATAIIGFLNICDKMIDPEVCIKSPETAPIPKPDESQISYALSVAIAHRADVRNFENIGKYAARLRREFRSLIISMAVRRVPALQASNLYISWLAETANGISN